MIRDNEKAAVLRRRFISPDVLETIVVVRNDQLVYKIHEGYFKFLLLEELHTAAVVAITEGMEVDVDMQEFNVIVDVVVVVVVVNKKYQGRNSRYQKLNCTNIIIIIIIINPLAITITIITTVVAATFVTIISVLNNLMVLNNLLDWCRYLNYFKIPIIIVVIATHTV